MATGDIDNDGDLDLLQVNNGQALGLIPERFNYI